MAAGVSTRNRATMEKSSLLFVEVESLCGATGYPLRTPRLEDTVLDAHTREPITVITERYLGVLRFCRWSQPGHNQKLAHLISEIRVERSHLMFCTICHKIDITTGYCSCVCVCVCVFFPSILDIKFVGRTSRGHTGGRSNIFLIHLPSAVRALIFVARRIQPFLSLVDREVEFCVLTN